MKTIVIWDSCGEEQIQFFVLDGDYSYFNKVYIGINANIEYQKKLNALMYDEEGNQKIEFFDDFPMQVTNEGFCVIKAGLIP